MYIDFLLLHTVIIGLTKHFFGSLLLVTLPALLTFFIQFNSADVFESTGPTPGSFVRVKMGADSSGKLTAAEAYIAFESGAYPGGLVGAAAMCVLACYDIPNGFIDCYDVVVNKPRSFAYRAPGSTQVAFCTEKAMVALAKKLGMDPIDFRTKNAAVEGTRRTDGVVYPRIGCKETLEVAKQHAHYSAPLEGPNRGRGFALGYWFNVGLKSSVVASVNNDGTVHLVEGSTDIGGTRTSVAMQAAEVLGITAVQLSVLVMAAVVAAAAWMIITATLSKKSRVPGTLPRYPIRWVHYRELAHSLQLLKEMLTLAAAGAAACDSSDSRCLLSSSGDGDSSCW